MTDRDENYLRENLLGQTRALEEGDSFGTADTAISIQIRTSKISIEEIDIRRLVLTRCHCRIQQHQQISQFADQTTKNKTKKKIHRARGLCNENASERSQTKQIQQSWNPLHMEGICFSFSIPLVAWTRGIENCKLNQEEGRQFSFFSPHNKGSSWPSKFFLFFFSRCWNKMNRKLQNLPRWSTIFIFPSNYNVSPVSVTIFQNYHWIHWIICLAYCVLCVCFFFFF